MTPVLEVHDLAVTIGGLPAVRGISFGVARAEVVGMVGESGSGKTLSALAVLGLLPDGATASGSVRVLGRELVGLSERELSSHRGASMAIVFQDALAALDPLMPIGRQVVEPLRIRGRLSRLAGERRAVELLERVRLPDPERQSRMFPHQLSGGQRQRATIAMALAAGPALLIADEPTTALDASLQLEIVGLLQRLAAEDGIGLLLITHNLPLAVHISQRLLVMYGGRIVEAGRTAEVLRTPRHPYTEGLSRAVPRITTGDASVRRLSAIPGTVPQLGEFPPGCPFRDRCPRADHRCTVPPGTTRTDGRAFECWHPLDGTDDPRAGPHRPAAAVGPAP